MGFRGTLDLPPGSVSTGVNMDAFGLPADKPTKVKRERKPHALCHPAKLDIPGGIRVWVPVEVVSEANQGTAGNWHGKWSRGKTQQRIVGAVLGMFVKPCPEPPLVVTMTRIGGKQMDTDNLAGSFKAVRDAVARFLGIDDRHAARVRYDCQQRTRKNNESYGCTIEIVARKGPTNG